MKDYIDILIKSLYEWEEDHPNGALYSQSVRQTRAEKALMETLSETQTKLFFAYEQAVGAFNVKHEQSLARQAFLLAWEIYR